MAQPTVSFSSQPFTKSAKAKQQFSSADFIYGKLDLPKTVEEFFAIPGKWNNPDYPGTVLIYKVIVEKDGEKIGSSNAWQYTRITSDQKKSKTFFFDVLPEPTAATTMVCGLSDYSSNVSAAPLYMMFDRSHFPENGKYTIKIEIQYWTMDPYNPDTPTIEEEWTKVAGEFEFDFNTKDLKDIMANATSAASLVKDNARVAAMEAVGLPEQWNWKPANINVPYSVDELTKLFLAREGDTCQALKAVIYPVKAPQWIVEKNGYDIPLFKWHNQMFGFFAENNGRYFYISGGLRQNHEGAGTYGEIFFQWTESTELSPKFMEPVLGKKTKGKK